MDLSFQLATMDQSASVHIWVRETLYLFFICIVNCLKLKQLSQFVHKSIKANQIEDLGIILNASRETCLCFQFPLQLNEY